MTSSHIEVRILLFFSSCGEKLGVPRELQQGTLETSHVTSGRSYLVSCEGECKIALESLWGIGTHLTMRGKSGGVSRVAAGKFGFLSSYDGDLREPFMLLPPKSQTFFHVVGGTLGFLSCHCSVIQPHLELRKETQGPSPAVTGVTGYLSRFNRLARPLLILRLGTPLCTQVVKKL